MRKRSLERQDTLAQYDDYIENDTIQTQIDDTASLYSSTINNTRLAHGFDQNDYRYGIENVTEDRQWDSGGYGAMTNNKLLPKVPITNSFSMSENISSPHYRGAALPPTPSYSKKTRLLPQPYNPTSSPKILPSTPRLLPQMPQASGISQSKVPLIRRSDTEYSDQESLHSIYSYRPGAVSAMQYNEDYNYAYQSTDSLNATALSECGARRIGATLPSVPSSQNYKYAQALQHTTIGFDIDNTDQNSLYNEDNINTSHNNYSNGDNEYERSDLYSELPIERKSKKLPNMPHAKQLPQIPATAKSNNKFFTESTRKRLPVVNKSSIIINNVTTSSRLLSESLEPNLSNNYSLFDDPLITDVNTTSSMDLSTSYFSNSNNNTEQLYDKASADDVYGINGENNLINNSYYNSEKDDQYMSTNQFNDSVYNSFGYYGPTTNATTTYDHDIDSSGGYDQSIIASKTSDHHSDYYDSYPIKIPYGEPQITHSASVTTTAIIKTTTTASSNHTSTLFTSATSATSFVKNSLGYATKITTPTTSTANNITSNAGSSTLSAAGNIGASITSSIGIGISKTLSSMFQTKTNQPPTSNTTVMGAHKDHMTSTAGDSFYNNIKTPSSTVASSIFPMANMTKIDITEPSTASLPVTNLTVYNNPEEEIMNEVSGNIVDYNSSDYKYIYDEYSENDYIATGDIITSNKNNYNNNYTDYCNSDVDTSNILDSKTTDLNNVNNSDELGNAQSTILSASIINNKNLYCDKTSSNNAYNLMNNHVHSDKSLINVDPSLSIYNNGGYDYINGTTDLLSIGKESLDPNEVYREDYEEDFIHQGQTSSTAIINNYNQSYQTPYYNYQEDYFNEEDEYKYLEKEREEAGMEETEVLESNQSSVEKKPHLLRAQESISDNDFFLQHLEGGVKPHTGYLNKQESIIEEVEPFEEQDEYEEKIEPIKTIGFTASFTSTTTHTSTISSSIGSSIATTVTPIMTSRPLSILAAMTTTTTAQALSTTKQPGDIVTDIIGAAVPPPSSLSSMINAPAVCNAIGGDATAMMMAAAKLATTATGPATTTKVDDVIEDVTKKKQLGSTDDSSMAAGTTGRKSGATSKQRWLWAYNKILMQLNVSNLSIYLFHIICCRIKKYFCK